MPPPKRRPSTPSNSSAAPFTPSSRSTVQMGGLPAKSSILFSRAAVPDGATLTAKSCIAA